MCFYRSNSGKLALREFIDWLQTKRSLYSQQDIIRLNRFPVETRPMSKGESSLTLDSEWAYVFMIWKKIWIDWNFGNRLYFVYICVHTIRHIPYLGKTPHCLSYLFPNKQCPREEVVWPKWIVLQCMSWPFIQDCTTFLQLAKSVF